MKKLILTMIIACGLISAQAQNSGDWYVGTARYYLANYFVYVKTTGLNTDAMSVGVGKMFTIHKGIYVDPKIVYNTEEKTTNLTLGFGLKF